MLTYRIQRSVLRLLMRLNTRVIQMGNVLKRSDCTRRPLSGLCSLTALEAALARPNFPDEQERFPSLTTEPCLLRSV